MAQVAREDVLKGLKKFKRLAKQDLLASSLTSNPDFWAIQAKVRREVYADLMSVIEAQGVDAGISKARVEYDSVSTAFTNNPGEISNPAISGKKQALEMFFQIVGLDQERAAGPSLVAK